MPPQRTAKRTGSRTSVIDLTAPTATATAVQGITLETLCNGPEIDEEGGKELATKLMGMLVKQPWLKWAMQDEIAADVGKEAISGWKDTKDYYLTEWIESGESQEELFGWAKEQFEESGQADEAREQAKREIKQEMEAEIRASPQKMAALERSLKRKLEREIRADPAKLARVHEMVRVRELIPQIEKAIRDKLEGMDE
jgi:hypothetical protein